MPHGTALRRGTYDFTNVRDKRTAMLQRYNALKSERSTYIVHWSDISRHLLPRNGRFFVTDRNRTSSSRYNAIYDNTATLALRALGAGMQAGITNPARPWFRLTTADPDLGDRYEVRAWLDDVVRRMQRVFAKSNTYRVTHQMYEEMGAFGISATLLLSDPVNVIHHYPLTCGEFCLQQDYQGRIVSLYREFEKSVGETVKEFGLHNCSRATQDAWHNRTLESPVHILHVIEPRADQERDPWSRHARDMPFKSCYLELNAEDDILLRESGYRRFPVIAPRWSVAGGDVYASSCPGMEALGDIRQLQQEQLRKGQAIDYMARPPLQVPTALRDRSKEFFPGGAVYVDPGTMLPVDQVGPNGGVRTAFDVKLDLSHLNIDLLDVRQRIEKAFHTDLFRMLDARDKTMTATEVAELQQEKLAMLGPVLGRVENELLHPLIDLTFDHMVDAGLLPPAPEELQGQPLTIEFVSILAQAQKAMGSSAVDRFMGNVVALAEVRPEVLDKVNFDNYVDIYGEMLGVETDLIVDGDDVAVLRQARARAEAAEAKVMMQREQAAMTKDAASVKTDERNVVADVLNSGVAAEEVMQ